MAEIDKKFKIFTAGDVVVDLGAAPGSWLQYISKAVGPRGLVYGIDKQPIAPLPAANVKIIKCDISHLNKLKLLPPACAVIVSDLAPDTTGTKFADSIKSLTLLKTAVDIATAHLKPGGNFVGKIFASREFDEFFKTFSKKFSTSKRFKPSACRDSSKELYIIGKNFSK